MDIKELNKKQLILLTLLITFVVSIATGIITVSLMQQAPKAVTQTVNNVIQRTIEKVTTVPATDTSNNTKNDNKGSSIVLGDGDAMVSIYPKAEAPIDPGPGSVPPKEEPKALGQGIIISDTGLVLVDSNILTDKEVYRVILNKVDFDATVIKKFSNGFSVLKISQKNIEKEGDKKDTNQGASAATYIDKTN